MAKPDLALVPPYYHNYINLVAEDDLPTAFEQHLADLSLLQAIPEEKWDYRYAEGKWTIRELVQHIIDTERIFSYRALCIARKDKTPLPSFDENQYAAASKANNRSTSSLLGEWEAVQKATQQLFASFNKEQLEAEGIANQKSISVRAIGFILIGHAKHHNKIVKERYL